MDFDPTEGIKAVELAAVPNPTAAAAVAADEDLELAAVAEEELKLAEVFL